MADEEREDAAEEDLLSGLFEDEPKVEAYIANETENEAGDDDLREGGQGGDGQAGKTQEDKHQGGQALFENGSLVITGTFGKDKDDLQAQANENQANQAPGYTHGSISFQSFCFLRLTCYVFYSSFRNGSVCARARSPSS